GGAPGDGPWINVYGITETFRRTLLDHWPLWRSSRDHHAPGEPMSHDQWVYFLAHALGGVRALDADLLGYRQHGTNVCGFVVPRRRTLLNTLTENLGAVAREVAGDRGVLTAKKKSLAELFEAMALAAESRARICDEMQRAAAPRHPAAGVAQYYQD